MLTHFIYIAKCMSRCIIWHISGWHWYFCDNVLNPRWPPWDMGKCHGLFILIANCIFSLQRMLYERCSGRKIRDRPVKSPLAARVPRVSCDLIQTWLYNFDWRILRLFLTVQPSILPVINPRVVGTSFWYFPFPICPCLSAICGQI